MKAILIILDSVGIGAAPDAADYGDAGSATLPNLAAAVGGVKLPTMQKMGLGNIPPLLHHQPPLAIAGVPAEDAPNASYGAMREVSEGKDTITGHWEIAGLEVRPGFHNFPFENSFPPDLIADFERETGRKLIGNKAASGTVIIEELGREHLETGALICYTSADSVFQIAAHEEVVPVPELYRYCEIARRLCDPLRVGRIIARPFVGEPGSFKRTENRKDFAYLPEEKTILERLVEAGVPVYAVGKIEDIYAHRGITESVHTGNNMDSQALVAKWTREKEKGLIMANYIDYDMLYGHRRDPRGYADSLEKTDQWLASYLPLLGVDDLLIITADHGNDPTFEGTDHTREYVPLLVYRKGQPAQSLGVREGFYDIAQSLAAYFGLPPLPRGASFLG
ncbi:MAG: phosphopentomutase [Lentisphaerae bacterium]|jgi:phosphopentomutase|nr:phosphopentomutase [Lentisphaerota bacterium]